MRRLPLHRLKILCGCCLLLALSGSALGVQLFDFDGQAIIPGSLGGSLEMVAKIVNGGQVTTPLPLDVANFEYTIHVSNAVLSVAGNPEGYLTGDIVLYEDAGTAADFADASTFTDGTALLVGEIVGLERTMVTTSLGTVVAVVNWTGGTRVNDFAPADQSGWAFLVNVDRFPSNVVAGYSERWDGKVEPWQEVVATELSSWSRVKANF